MSVPQVLNAATQQGSLRREILLVIAFAVALFAVLNVNLGRLQFTNAGETVVVEAALETRRGGNWWIPTLLGVPRVIKPPLTTWIAASAISQRTLADLSSPIERERSAAYEQLAREVRRPFVACSCLTLIAIYGLGRILAGGRVGVVAAVIAGTSLLFLRHGRLATTDVQLTLWVNIANFFLALALFRRRYWIGAVGAGLALGLSIMSKGPVGLVQSVVPFAIFALGWRWLAPGGQSAVSGAAERSRAILPVIAAAAILLAIAAPWPVSVYLVKRDIIAAWTREITRVGATPNRPDAWWNYIVILPNMAPWVPLFIAGLCIPILRRFGRSRLMLAWLLLTVPVVVMSCAPDINIRYATPMVGAAAILAAAMAVELLRPREQMPWPDKLLEGSQWIVSGAMAAAIVAGGFAGTAGTDATTATGASWYSMPLAIGGTGLGGGAMIAAWILRRRVRLAWIVSSAIVSLTAYMLFMVGYVRSPSGMASYKPAADALWRQYPDAQTFYYDPRPETRHVPTDLAIYLNRIVYHVDDPAQLKPSGRPQVVFMLQRKNEPKPELPGWRETLWERVGKQTCYAFTRE